MQGRFVRMWITVLHVYYVHDSFAMDMRARDQTTFNDSLAKSLADGNDGIVIRVYGYLNDLFLLIVFALLRDRK